MQEFNPEEHKDPQKPLRESILKNLHPFVYVLIVLAVIFLLYQVIGAALVIAAGGGENIETFDVKTMRIVLTFGQFMFILAPVLFFARFQTAELKKMFRLNAPKFSLVLLAVMGVLLIQPFLQGYIYFQDLAVNSIPFLRDIINPLKEILDELEEAVMKIAAAHSPYEFAVVVFVICVTPAICEEFLFRGFVLTNLRRASRANIAIFLSGFLFAIYHFQPFNLIPLVILGWYLGFIVYYSNSIYTGVLCHFINNFFAAYYLYVFGKPDLENPNLTASETANTLIFAALSVILFISVVMLFYRIRVKEETA